jgi:hypothetical protein
MVGEACLITDVNPKVNRRLKGLKPGDTVVCRLDWFYRQLVKSSGK